MNSTGTISDAVKCQASMLPHVAEQYRCMLVWDKKTNRDVGWVMVRKKNVKGMTPDDMVADMSQCQWRTWNVSRREDESLGEVFRDASLKEDAGTKLISADEASTSDLLSRKIYQSCSSKLVVTAMLCFLVVK